MQRLGHRVTALVSASALELRWRLGQGVGERRQISLIGEARSLLGGLGGWRARHHTGAAARCRRRASGHQHQAPRAPPGAMAKRRCAMAKMEASSVSASASKARAKAEAEAKAEARASFVKSKG
ncbi:hypothetical protein NL676_036071 [Syzygium grande]|nr:hypothetical protein NL676_036071 [Syzygium grande]